MDQRSFDSLLDEELSRWEARIEPPITPALWAYFSLLKHWNRRINLTALPLDPLTPSAADRLFVEPILAAKRVLTSGTAWFDIGSGGGSPAIPMFLVQPSSRLVMVESKGRKASFLREVIRELSLAGASVAELRLEGLAETIEAQATADLVVVRAVRPDDQLLAAAAGLLRSGGELAVFRTDGGSPSAVPEDADIQRRLVPSDSFPLLPGTALRLFRKS